MAEEPTQSVPAANVSANLGEDPHSLDTLQVPPRSRAVGAPPKAPDASLGCMPTQTRASARVQPARSAPLAPRSTLPFAGHGQPTSRRSWLATLAGFGAAAAVAPVRPAAAAPPTTSIGDPDSSALLPKLVQRLTFGLTPYELNLARAIGYDGYLDHHLNPDLISDSAAESRIAGLVNLNKIYAEIYLIGMSSITNELIEATLLRAIYSRCQLRERMVEFWTDHFNISVDKENCSWLKVIDDRDAIRANCMGIFGDLLAASATSPAMLTYLDNHISIGTNPNLNYARELMELHTIGVNGGYTEEDVVNVARCFTGWQVFPNNFGFPLAGTFRYNTSQHDNGQKRVLGHVIPAGGGIQDGLTVLAILTDHPSTARFIATKMCKRLLDYNASPSLINTVAAKFAATGGNIRETLRTVFAAAHVQAAAPKLKRPFHHFVSAARATEAEVISTSSFRTQLRAAGHLTFSWTAPDGYPDSLDFWSGLLLPRWNFGAQMMNNSLSGVTTNAANYFAGLTTAGAMVGRINANMFGGELPAPEMARIREYLLPDAPTATRQREALGLAIGCPAFQMF